MLTANDIRLANLAHRTISISDLPRQVAVATLRHLSRQLADMAVDDGALNRTIADLAALRIAPAAVDDDLIIDYCFTWLDALDEDTDLLISLAAHGGVEVAESLDCADIHRCLGLIVDASADATTINYWLRAVGNHPDILGALPATHLVRWVRGCVTDA